MKNKQYKNELTYETIKKAVAGNVDAQDDICDYYEQYIIKLSKIPYLNEHGELNYKIDEDLYMSLKVKLYEVISTFVVA